MAKKLVANSTLREQKTKCYFICKDQTNSIIIEDQDQYTKSFSEQDVKMRQLTQSLYQCYNGGIEFTQSDILILNSIAQQADTILWTYGFTQLSATPWRFCLTAKNSYEFGLPHTRMYNDRVYIFLSNNKEHWTLDTLIHEKLHVLQKLYPQQFNKIYEQRELYKVSLPAQVGKRLINREDILANPDTEKEIYKQKNSDIMFIGTKLLNQTGPQSHPHEYIAYQLARLLTNLSL